MFVNTLGEKVAYFDEVFITSTGRLSVLSEEHTDRSGIISQSMCQEYIATKI